MCARYQTDTDTFTFTPHTTMVGTTQSCSTTPHMVGFQRFRALFVYMYVCRFFHKFHFFGTTLPCAGAAHPS